MASLAKMQDMPFFGNGIREIYTFKILWFRIWFRNWIKTNSGFLPKTSTVLMLLWSHIISKKKKVPVTKLIDSLFENPKCFWLFIKMSTKINQKPTFLRDSREFVKDSVEKANIFNRFFHSEFFPTPTFFHLPISHPQPTPTLIVSQAFSWYQMKYPKYYATWIQTKRAAQTVYPTNFYAISLTKSPFHCADYSTCLAWNHAR